MQLILVLCSLFAEGFDFSTKIPACELLIERKRSNAIEKVIELENIAVSPLTLRSVKIGGNSRMKVMAEIVDAGNLEKKELTKKIIYFVESGADIIDLGNFIGYIENKCQECC